MQRSIIDSYIERVVLFALVSRFIRLVGSVSLVEFPTFLSFTLGFPYPFFDSSFSIATPDHFP